MAIFKPISISDRETGGLWYDKNSDTVIVTVGEPNRATEVLRVPCEELVDWLNENNLIERAR